MFSDTSFVALVARRAVAREEARAGSATSVRSGRFVVPADVVLVLEVATDVVLATAPELLVTRSAGCSPFVARSALILEKPKKRVYGQFCIETLHESRKWKSNGLSCLFE